MQPISTFILISKVIWPPIALACAWHHLTFCMCSCLYTGLFKNSPSMCDEGPSILGNFLFFPCVNVCQHVSLWWPITSMKRSVGEKQMLKVFRLYMLLLTVLCSFLTKPCKWLQFHHLIQRRHFLASAPVNGICYDSLTCTLCPSPGIIHCSPTRPSPPI